MSVPTFFNKSNVIYKITDDIIMDSGDVLYLPQDVTLDFQGGSIIGGKIVLDRTKILPNGCVISDYITSEISGSFAQGQMMFDTERSIPKWFIDDRWVDITELHNQ